MTRRMADWLLVSVGLATGASLAAGYCYAFMQRPAPTLVITKEDVALPETAQEKKKTIAARKIEI